MGTRSNIPSSPSGSEEAASTSITSTSPAPRIASAARRGPRKLFGIDRRLILAPLSALLLGSVFYVYSRTTVAAAKENARRAREADGGSISWRREGMRRHGRLEKPEERTLWAQLMKGKEGVQEGKGREKQKVEDFNPIEEGIRKARDRRRAAEQRNDGG